MNTGQLGVGTLVAQAPFLLVTVDSRMRVIGAAGQGLERCFGAADSLLGHPVRDALSGHQTVIHALERGVAGEETTSVALENDLKLAVHASPESHCPEHGAIALCIDVGTAELELHQREAQVRLDHSDSSLAEAQRLAHVGSWEWLVEDDRLEWSEELQRIYGLAPGTSAGKLDDFFDHVHPADRELAHRTVLDALRNRQPFELDQRILRHDGGVRTVHIRGEVRVDKPDGTVRMVGSCSDVTERWEASQERERSLSLIRATLESTADGLLVVDRSGKMTAFNQRFAEMWALPEDVRKSQDDRAALSVVLAQLEEPEAFEARVRDLYSQSETESYDVLHFKDGRVFERYSRPQRVGQEVVGRVWSFRDVTERERLLRTALFLADASRLLASLDAEPAVEAVAHLAVPFLGDACALDLFAQEGGPRRLLAVTREIARTPPGDLPRAALSGHSLIYESGGRSCMAVPLLARDTLLGVLSFASREGRTYRVPDLQLAEEVGLRIALAFDNARLYQHAQESLAARDEFLSIAAHELRGPATSLRLVVQGLRSGRTPDATIPQLLDICDRQVRQITRFIDELLDVSRIRAQRLPLTLEEVDLGAVVHDVAARMTLDLSRSGSALSLAVQPIVGRWDRLRLEQLVQNLLSNAIKFGLGKPIEVTTRVDRNRTLLTITDHGIGIPKDRQDAIFRPFERAVSSRHYGGLGLGLYICRSIVEALGGSLSVRSEEGKGSTFLIELPEARVS